jgi:hypothetical protein
MAFQLWVLLHIFRHVWVLGWLALDESYVVEDQIGFGILEAKQQPRFGGSHKDGNRKQRMTTRKQKRLC